MYDQSNIEWSSSCYSLKDLVKNFSLPQLVMVEEGYMLNETESLCSGQLITVQSHEIVTQFKGIDSEGKEVILPAKCPFKVKLVAKDDGRVYRGIRELCEAPERPKYVEVKSSRTKRDLGLVKSGDRLKILLTERGPNGPTYLHFRNQRGKHLRLPVEFNCEFRGCAEDDNEHLLTDLLGKDLPLYMKFADNSDIGESIGVIELKECLHDTLVYTSMDYQGRMFATAFPLSLDVQVRPMSDAPKVKSNNERIRDSVNIDAMNIDKFKELMARDKDIHDNGYVYFAPFDLIKEKSAAENETVHPNGVSPDKASDIANQYEEPVNNVNSAKRKSQGFLSRVRLKLRGSKSTNRKSQEMRPEIIIVDRQSGASSDGGDSGIYEQIPAADTYVSMDVIDGARRAFQSPKKSVGKKRNVSRVQSSAVPPPLPGNHPVERRHTITSKLRASPQHKHRVSRDCTSERDNFKKFYESMKKSETEILNCDLDGVANVLKDLKLHKYINKFLDNQIDGKLLVDLDEAVFKDIGLSPFEARKLRKYVFGWRPDAKKVENYSSNYAENSEALKWNESEVAEHVSNLGLREFCEFCKLNQVNGDLLWDMVVDEEIINGLLTGSDRRLNAVKLKNYVTEGWRPKVSKKRSNSIHMGTLEKRSKAKDASKAKDTSSSISKDSKPQRKITPSEKSATTSVTRRHSVTPSTEAMSPASSQSDKQSSAGSSRSGSRPQSRLQAKVSYPKNSPYGKPGSVSKSDDKALQTFAKKPEKPSVSSAKSKAQETGLKANGSKSTLAKTVKTQNIQGERKTSQTRPNIADAKLRESAASKKGQTEAASSTRNEAGIAKIPSTRKSLSLRSKSSTNKTEAKNAAQVTKEKSEKSQTTTNSNSAFHTSPKVKQADKKEESGKNRAKLTTKSTARENNGKKDMKPAGQKTNTRENEIGLTAKPECTESETIPSIASLRQQFENKDEPAFRPGDKLRRTGKNELRMAIKRKDSPGKERTTSESDKSLSSVTHLKKQFDSKPIL